MRRVLATTAYLLLIVLNAVSAKEAPLNALVGRKFSIESNWTGYELEFTRSGESIAAIWRVLGSGRPVISEKTYPVEHRGENQYRLFVEIGGKQGEIQIDIDARGEIRAYLNSVRIYIRESRPNQSLEPTPTAVTPRADARVAPAAGVAHH